jgi:PKD repeat protein
MRRTGRYRNIISIMVACLLVSAMLQSAGAAGSDSVTISGYILPHTAPDANFTASPRSGYSPLVVQFTDISSGAPTARSWDFQNDGIVDSNAQNPSYTYSSPGTYAVKLHVTNAYGSDTEIKTGFITVTGSNPLVRISAQRQYASGLSIPLWSKWLLTTPLRNAENALDRGNERAAVLHMRSYIENVRILRWLRIITNSQSEYMISEANAIISMIQE